METLISIGRAILAYVFAFVVMILFERILNKMEAILGEVQDE